MRIMEGKCAIQEQASGKLPGSRPVKGVCLKRHNGVSLILNYIENPQNGDDRALKVY